VVFLWKAAVLACALCSIGAQEVSIPDAGLNAAIREALQKTSGPLTQQDLLSLTNLSAGGRSITGVAGLESARNLRNLDLGFNKLRSFVAPIGLTNLNSLSLLANQLTNLTLQSDMTQLSFLSADANQLSSFALPPELTRLNTLRLDANMLVSFALPSGMTNLTFVALAGNQLTNLVLPSDLGGLAEIDLGENNLTSFTLSAGLTNLATLTLDGNQLTNVTLAPDATKLVSLFVNGNPLKTLVLSEPMSATNLAATVVGLRDRGISVFTYPLTVQLLPPQPLAGVIQFEITGPPGAYGVFASSDLATWGQVGIATNIVGDISFVDVASHTFPQRFYRALPQNPRENMVFIPPNTFTMGSSTNELHRQPNEGPQTAVTLTRGFWIGKFEVTQGEYLSVMNMNPSLFPGDLKRPVSSVSWFDATNYCWKLTQRELAAGDIPAGSEYRLPTEAEWECVARAGTTTRFSYGDDLDYTSLTSYAWFILNSGFPSTLTLHPAGLKAPNPWGLYDMEGNVWEWTQDWLGDLTGGAVTDPSGPPSNAIGWKVVRGGAYDFDSTDCRSARRFFFPAVGNDTDIGFRIVLVIGSR
jgi:formylglycine-generating enzyme required for sulfatase activity